MTAARQAWLAAHPFLEPIARFEGIVAAAAAEARPPPPPAPRQDAYAADRASGVPLLRSAAAGLDLSPAVEMLAGLAERVADASPPGDVAHACRELGDDLRGRVDARRAVAWVVAHGAAPAPDTAHRGLLRFLGWGAVRRLLAPILEDAGWRGEEGWGRGSCPTCGALPPTAQLVAAEGARARRLACGCCRTRWAYRRIGCPFCGGAAPERLGILEVDGGEVLRIDVCDGCKGYLKTYTGEGEEELFLADWPTLHLDLVARRRGLRRAGASLYELPDEEMRSEP